MLSGVSRGQRWCVLVHVACGSVPRVRVLFPAWFIFPPVSTLSVATLPACLFVVSDPPSAPLQNGFAIIRPPGHHAEESTAM